MSDKDRLVRIFVGTEISCLSLKAYLEESGIASMIKDEYHSSIQVGYVSGTPSSIELYIYESELEKAKPLIAEFIADNPE